MSPPPSSRSNSSRWASAGTPFWSVASTGNRISATVRLPFSREAQGGERRPAHYQYVREGRTRGEASQMKETIMSHRRLWVVLLLLACSDRSGLKAAVRADIPRKVVESGKRATVLVETREAT